MGINGGLVERMGFEIWMNEKLAEALSRAVPAAPIGPQA